MISDVNARNLKIINQHIATLEKKILDTSIRRFEPPEKVFLRSREIIYSLAKNLILCEESPDMICLEKQSFISGAFKTKEDFENRLYSTFYHDFQEEIEYVVFAVSFLKDVHIPSETLVKLFDSCPYNHFGEFGGYHNGIYNAYGITFGNEKEWSLKGKAFYISVLFTHFEMCGTIPSPVFLDNRTRIFSPPEPDTKDNMIAATCAASSPPLNETTKNEDEKMTNTNGTTPSVRDLFKIDRQKGPMGNLFSAFGAGAEIGAAGAMSGAATDFVLSRLSSGSPTAAALIKNTPFVRPVFDFVVPVFVYFIAYYSMFPGVSPETQAKFAQHALLAIVSHSDTVVAILGRDFLSSLTRHMLNAISEWESNPLGSDRR